MYLKYNAVLRFFSGNAFLQKQCVKYKLTKEMADGKVEWLNKTKYATTIHAINSCVIKMSKLTIAQKVWRGIKDAKLPKSFWVPNNMGVRGGIEYGFSSTTTDKAQAMHYAGVGDTADHASTVFEFQMGMVDRGADLRWCSQCACFDAATECARMTC